MSTAIASSPGRRSPLAWLILAVVRLYQLSAAWRTPRCRFLPTCSHYAHEAITVHGAVRGGWMAVRRIGRCHPWNPGGLDPVPARDDATVLHPLPPHETK